MSTENTQDSKPPVIPPLPPATGSANGRLKPLWEKIEHCRKHEGENLPGSAARERWRSKRKRLQAECFEIAKASWPNARTQRPGASDAPIATESAPPGSLE